VIRGSLFGRIWVTWELEKAENTGQKNFGGQLVSQGGGKVGRGKSEEKKESKRREKTLSELKKNTITVAKFTVRDRFKRKGIGDWDKSRQMRKKERM